MFIGHEENNSWQPVTRVAGLFALWSDWSRNRRGHTSKFKQLITHESVNFCLAYQGNYIQKYYFLYMKTHSSVVISGHSSAWRRDIYSQLLPSGIFNDAHMSDLIPWTFLTCRDFYDLSEWDSTFISKMQHELVKYVVGVRAWLRREAINSEEASRYSRTSLGSGDLVENVL